MTNGISTEEFRRKLGLPTKPKALAPMSAEEFRKAGGAEAAVRIREAEEAKQRRAKALERDHTDSATIRIIGLPPSLNELMGGKLKNRMSVKAAYKELVHEAWIRAGKPVVQSPYTYKVHLIISTRRGDRSNLTHGAIKCALDALTDCGCIQGDSYTHDIGEGPHTRELGKFDMVVLTLTHKPKAKF